MAASASAEPAMRWSNVLAGLWCMLCATLAAAHPMPESRVWIDTTPGGLRLTLQLPLNRLEYGYGQPLADQAATVLARHADGLARYLLLHVGARSRTQGWQALRPALEVTGNDASAELHAVLELRAPPGADARAPTLLYDAITHEVRTHRVQVFLRSDWAGGFAGEPPLLLGELDHGNASLPLHLDRLRPGASLRRLAQAGALHIAQGTDHLLFLLMLVIVAPLAASAGRWSQARPAGSAARRLAAVVTAFTVGHSLTLALGSSGWLVLPAQPVEVAVALSIAFAALHALRPLRTDGELWMAAGFGLVHGFAFSASLSGAGLTAWQHAQALFAFNLGIEAMQLALLLALLPPLLMLCCRPAAYAAVRRGVAAVALLLALTWAVLRATGGSASQLAWLDDATPALPFLIGLAWLAALASWAGRMPRAAVVQQR